MPVIECDESVARKRLEQADIAITSGNTAHERWRAETDDGVAVAYDGKVVIQGSAPERLEALVREGGGRVHLYADGAARGNPGPAAIGWVLVDGTGIVTEGGKRIGRATNNRAEYEALIEALSVAGAFGFDEVVARSDSELVVRQVTDEWNVDDPDLRECRLRVHEQLTQFDDWSVRHVPRELNERADELANNALDET